MPSHNPVTFKLPPPLPPVIVQSAAPLAKRHIKAFRATNDYVAKLIVGPALIKEDRFIINQVRPGQLPEGFLIAGSWYEHSKEGFFIVVEHPSFPEHKPGTDIPLIDLEVTDIEVERVTTESEAAEKLMCESAKEALAENESLRARLEKSEREAANYRAWICTIKGYVDSMDVPELPVLKFCDFALTGAGEPAKVLGVFTDSNQVEEKSVESRLTLLIIKAVSQSVGFDHGTELREELGLDALALVVLACQIEEEFKIEISHNEMCGLGTFGDLLVLVTAKLDEKS